MPELCVSDLAFTHVGSHLVVACSTERGPQPYAGVLFDVVHRAGGPSWLSFRVHGTPVVLVVEDPSTTIVSVEEVEPPVGPAGVPRQIEHDSEPLRQHTR
ncbi:hypothetical protein OG218_02695 [Kineococcus sp. NBC_00420]|uniref:hypothetical protein n=1 Tax=unclassified Kineococcus TaxID=2621656 RepID=UPI002E233E49